MKRIKHILLFALFGGVFIFSGYAQVERKIAEKIVADLTSAEMHGRGYVNQGDKKAADYILNYMTNLGVKASMQPFKFDVNTFPDSMRVTANGRTLIPGVDYIVSPRSGSATGTYSTVYITKHNMLDIELNKIIYNPTTKSDFLIVLDAAGIKDKDSLMEFHALANAYVGTAPVIVLNDDKHTWSVSSNAQKSPVIELKREVFPGTDAVWNLNIKNQLVRNYESQNVIGVITGKHKKLKKKYLFVTAHYDHLGRMGHNTYFPGANDNASGTALMLLLMDHYKKNRPDYTMVFIAFGAEEAGLIGSKYYTQHPVYPLKDIRFLLNLDLMGNGQEGITVVNATVFAKDFKRLAEINKQTDWFTQIKTRGEAANSDHYWFTKAGVPSFFVYTMGGSSAYHDVFDTHEAIEFPKIKELLQLSIQFLDGSK